MDSRTIYTAAFAGLLWLQSTTYSHLFSAVGTEPIAQAKTLKAIFKGIEDRRLTLIEENMYGENHSEESYFAELEFENTNLKDLIDITNNEKSKVSYEYDADFNKTAVNIQRWDSQTYTWVKNLREILHYNDNGTLHENNYQAWDNNQAQWIPICREIYTYDRNDNLTQADLQWFEENGAWSQIARDTYRYNSDGYLSDYTSQLYDPQSKVWANTARHTYGYDTEGYEIEHATQKSAGRKDWDNQQRTTYDYATDPIAKRVEVTATNQKWQGKYWTNASRETKAHDDIQHQSETIGQYWNADASAWHNQHRQLKTYTDTGALNTNEHFYWNPETQQWENATRTINVYDEKNKLIEIIDQQWIGTEQQQQWVNTAQTKIAYSDETVLDNP